MEKDRSLEESAASSYCNILNKSRRLGKELVLGYSYEKGHGTLEVDIDDGKADSALVEADVAKDKNDLILHLGKHQFSLSNFDGAYNMRAKLSKKKLDQWVICSSAGNHGQGVALAAKTLGCDDVIVMPVTTPRIKWESVKRLGETVVLEGDSYKEAQAYAKKKGVVENRTFIPPFDHPDVISGQETVGMEIVRQLKGPIHAIFVPIGGGSLIDGIAAYKLDFKFPLMVSCVHFICSSIGEYVVIKVLKVKPLISVEPEDRWRKIFPMSFVFSSI
ncbi:threonine dehydratase biosynthetic, chloroplastic-like protein [Tanacetum coccineum]